MRVSIVCRLNRTFWRAGIEHYPEPRTFDVVKDNADHDNDEISEAEVKMCKAEPNLLVVELPEEKEEEEEETTDVYRDKGGKFSTKENDADGKPEKVARKRTKKK
jgi:hypothetical protein